MKSAHATPHSDDLGLVPSWLAAGSKLRNLSGRSCPLVRLLASDLAWPRPPSLPNSADRLSIYHREVTISHLFEVSSDSWALQCGFDRLLSKLLAGQLLHFVHCSSHNSKGLLISFDPHSAYLALLIHWLSACSSCCLLLRMAESGKEKTKHRYRNRKQQEGLYRHASTWDHFLFVCVCKACK